MGDIVNTITLRGIQYVGRNNFVPAQPYKITLTLTLYFTNVWGQLELLVGYLAIANYREEQRTEKQHPEMASSLKSLLNAFSNSSVLLISILSSIVHCRERDGSG
jgi:hypothetical protein